MATVLNTIQAAYRRSGVLAAGVNINAVQRTVGLERLQSLYTQFIVDGLFGALIDKRLTSADPYTAKEYERIVNTAAAAITYPATVKDCVTNEDRTPRDLCVISVVIPGADPEIRIYDAWRAAWLDTQGLSANDYAPLTGSRENHIKNLLAVLIADEAGFQIPPMLARQAATARLDMASKHGTPRVPVRQEYF